MLLRPLIPQAQEHTLPVRTRLAPILRAAVERTLREQGMRLALAVTLKLVTYQA